MRRPLKRRPERGVEDIDILGDNFDATPVEELFGHEALEQPESYDPGPLSCEVARTRSVDTLDPVVMFGMRLAVERCWMDGVTEPHLVLAEVLGRAAELGVAVVDPKNLYDHPRLGPWLLDQWPDEADSLDGFAEAGHERWKELGISPSEKVAWEQAGVVDPDFAVSLIDSGHTPDSLKGSAQFPSLPPSELCDTLGQLLYRREITPEQAHRMLRAGNLIRTGPDGITVLDAA